mmetsp:Transcript_39482/g.92852  ORF Transcript_39482/g.92852 Transcript_39482/m.92852 type:complete len:131 (+) Transcript_39482:74-466(+)
MSSSRIAASACSRCGVDGHAAVNCKAKAFFKTQCIMCHSLDHLVANCPVRTASEKAAYEWRQRLREERQAVRQERQQQWEEQQRRKEERAAQEAARQKRRRAWAARFPVACAVAACTPRSGQLCTKSLSL